VRSYETEKPGPCENSFNVIRELKKLVTIRNQPLNTEIPIQGT